MPKNDEAELRNQLVKLLEGGEAHLDFESAVRDFPVKLAGSKPNGAPHSGWDLLEHLRITQRDILDFSLGTDYRPLKWPDDYWPKEHAPADEAAWTESVQSFEKDLQSLVTLAKDQSKDLYTPFPHGEGQNLLRELLLVADHNSHHLGQLIYLKKSLASA